MKSNTITFFANSFDRAIQGLTDEQIGKALKLLAKEANGEEVPFTNDKQVFFAYKVLQGSMDYVIHTNRRAYMNKCSEVAQAKLHIE